MTIIWKGYIKTLHTFTKQSGDGGDMGKDLTSYSLALVYENIQDV